MAFPNAELVDGEPAMRAARRIKTADEIAALRGALEVAEDGLAAAVAGLAPGTTEQALTGVMLEAMAAGGVSTLGHPGRRVDHAAGPSVAASAGATARVADGDLVAFAAGALADGYVGEVGRTWPVGDVDGCRCAVPALESTCGTGSLPPAGPGRRPAICSPPTRRPASRCRRCRWRTASGSGSTRR